MILKRVLALSTQFGLILILGLSSCDSTLRDQIELFVNVKNSGIVYVDGINGDEANPGTRELPKKSIQNAIDLADALMDEGEVWVAEGTYYVYETLVVREGISIFGGFDWPGWSPPPDPGSAPATTIKGEGIETVIKPEEDVTAATVIEGFKIEAAAEDVVACLWCERSSPTVRFCMLDSSAGDEYTIGIFIQFGSPVILSNTINAGQGSEKARGILNEGASPKIWNNLIYGQGDNSTLIGISNHEASRAVIQNNTIRAGTTAGGIGIYNSDSNSVIENNIIFTDSGAGCGIYEFGSSALPERVRKNDLYNCDPVYRHDSELYPTVADMENYLDLLNGIPADGNKSDNPDFMNQTGLDWHLQSWSLVKAAGLDLSDYFTNDREDKLRTVPWSIGAYEQDEED